MCEMMVSNTIKKVYSVDKDEIQIWIRHSYYKRVGYWFWKIPKFKTVYTDWERWL